MKETCLMSLWRALLEITFHLYPSDMKHLAAHPFISSFIVQYGRKLVFVQRLICVFFLRICIDFPHNFNRYVIYSMIDYI